MTTSPSDAAAHGKSVFVETQLDVASSSAEPASPLVFVQEPTREPEYYVSYAWGDDTPEGREREAVVERLCTAAEKRGIRVLRDKRALGLGDRISKFMKLLGRGKRVFVVISDKYLKSPYCMNELFELWNHIRVYTLACAKIWTALDRTKYAVHWKEECGRLEALVKEHGDEILGEKDARQYRLMKRFSRQIGDVLATVTDILQPCNFEDLERYGFLEGPGHGSNVEP